MINELPYKLAQGETWVENGIQVSCGCIHYLIPNNSFRLCVQHNHPEFKAFMVRGCVKRGLKPPVFVDDAA